MSKSGKSNMLKVALPLILVAGAGVIGAKAYVNAEAEAQYNVYVDKFKAQNPDIEITTGSIAFNPVSSQFTATNVFLKSKRRSDSLMIRELSFTKPGDSNGIPEHLNYSVKGLELNIEKVKFNTPEEREIGYYLAGSDKIIEINAFGTEKVDKVNNRIILTSSVDIERLGNISVSFNLDGIYSELNESMQNGDIDKYKANPLAVLGKISISGLKISMETKDLRDLMNISGKQSNKTPSDLLAGLKQEREKVRASDQEVDVGKHFDDFIAAYENDKDLSVSVAFNKTIDQNSVMSLMMQGKPGDTGLVKELFGLELKTKVK